MASILKKLRLEQGLTIREVGEKIDLDWTVVSRIENGKRGYNEQTLCAFAKFFDVSTDYLLGLTEERRPEPKVIEKIVTVPANNNSHFSPEHKAVLDLIAKLDRDDLIMLKGMILALLSSRTQDKNKSAM